MDNHKKKIMTWLQPPTYIKINSRWITGPNVKAKTIKESEENRTALWFWHSQRFLSILLKKTNCKRKN